jgi:hypothetical protein
MIEESSYRPPLLYRNAHVQTVFPTLFRKVRGVHYVRERITTPDADFIDLDWSRVDSGRAAVVLHGLEGNSSRAYVQGMVRALNRRQWDAVVFNFRGCSGEPNRRLRLYHSGDTDDVETVVHHVISQGLYRKLAIIGFSIGGNMTLKYLGEKREQLPGILSKAVVFSVPCDLIAGAKHLSIPSNRLYLKRFLTMLCEKVQAKAMIMPGAVDPTPCSRARDFQDFDDWYTAPLHGFANYLDYWEKASSKPYIPAIRVPTLAISSLDDPFLPDSCYPVDEAKASESFWLELPRHGGHVGFVAFNPDREYWSEKRAMEFLDDSRDFAGGPVSQG